MITLDSINYANASIQIIDAAGDALAIAADGSIAVTDNGGSLTVDGVQFDIDDLTFADDKVDASGSEVSLDAATLAALESITVQNGAGVAAVNIQDGGNSITVDAVQLDIDDLNFSDDQVDVSGSEVSLDAATLAALETISIAGTVAVTQSTSPWVVSATDLDIRDLVFATDKVDVSGSTVNVLEGGFATWKVSAETVDTTVGGVELVSTPLAGRLKIEIQNLGSNDIYLRQATGVTTANGLKLPKGSSYEQPLDDGADVWAIAPAGTSDIRVAEYAA